MASVERPLRDVSLEGLIDGLRRSSPEGASPYCQEIIHRFEPLLRKAWRHLSQSIEHLAQPMEYRDFVQDVFVRLFGGLPNLREPRAFPGYFQRCVQSTVVTAIRRKRAPEENIDDRAMEIATRVDEEILTAVFLQSYLHLLPQRERTVLQLEWVDGLSPDEIATTLGLSRGGASAAKSRGISKLREIIAAEARWLEGAVRRTKQK
jgi:RNA polymerase sigma factor (sigma-70 family)